MIAAHGNNDHKKKGTADYAEERREEEKSSARISVIGGSLCHICGHYLMSTFTALPPIFTTATWPLLMLVLMAAMP